MRILTAVSPSPSSSPLPPPRRPSATSSSAAAFFSLSALAGTHAPSTYSPAKLLALHEYCATASRARVLAVLALTPVPAFLGSVLPSLVELENPLRGFAHNHSVVAHGLLLVALASFGTILLTLGATATPRHVYSEARALAVSVVAAALVLALGGGTCSSWRFPVPFFLLTAGPLWVLALVGTQAVLLRDNLRRYPQLGPSLARYSVPLALQIAQFSVYAALTVALDRVAPLYQLALVVVFPVIKLLLKRVLHRHTAALAEMGGEVALSTVEICASLYQSTMMQTAPSTLALCAIMGVDAVQGLLAIKFFVRRRVTTPHRELFPRALEILRRPASSETKASDADAVVAREALAVASAVGAVLLVEYFEVSVPVVSALFLLATFRSTSTLYNSRLNEFYDHPARVASSTALQAASLLAFQWALRRRHGVSAWRHLAFVLEYHARSIQGKLLVFFVLVFYFTTAPTLRCASTLRAWWTSYPSAQVDEIERGPRGVRANGGRVVFNRLRVTIHASKAASLALALAPRC